MGLNLWRIGPLLEVVILVRGERGLVGSLHLLDLSLTVHLEKIEIRLELLCLLLTTRGLELFAAFLVKKVLNFGIIWIDRQYRSVKPSVDHIAIHTPANIGAWRRTDYGD